MKLTPITGLRSYSTYKDTDIPSLDYVPEYWTIPRLKVHLKLNDSGIWSDEPDDTGTVVLRSTEQTLDGHWNIENPARLRIEEKDRSLTTLVAGDLLITKSSGSRTHIGKTTIVNTEVANLDCCFSNFMQRIRTDGTIRPRFLWYYLNNYVGREQLLAAATTTTGLANLNGHSIGNSKIPMPSPNEQAAIVRYLDAAEEQIKAYIGTKQKLIALLEEERQGVINQAVTRGLDPNVRLKPSGLEWLGDVPEHWEIRRSKRLFTPRGELARQNDIQLSATQAYGVIPQEEYERRVGRKIVRVSLHLEKRQHVEVDDFVISMRSFEGGLERAWATGCIRSSYIVLRPTTEVEVEFFAYVFKSQPYIRALQLTANFIRDGQDLNFNNFRAVDLPCPPTEEQRRTAGALRETITKIDTTIIRTRRQIELINEYRTRLIADVVTGKIDVRKAAEELPELEPTEITN